MNHTLRIKNIGIILVGLVALLSLMTIAMSPSVFADGDHVITLEQDEHYTNSGVHIQIKVYDWERDEEPAARGAVVTSCEYRLSGNFFEPSLEKV